MAFSSIRLHYTGPAVQPLTNQNGCKLHSGSSTNTRSKFSCLRASNFYLHGYLNAVWPFVWFHFTSDRLLTDYILHRYAIKWIIQTVITHLLMLNVTRAGGGEVGYRRLIWQQLGPVMMGTLDHFSRLFNTFPMIFNDSFEHPQMHCSGTFQLTF